MYSFSVTINFILCLFVTKTFNSNFLKSFTTIFNYFEFISDFASYTRMVRLLSDLLKRSKVKVTSTSKPKEALIGRKGTAVNPDNLELRAPS